jgi:hypothetical protein
MNNENNLSRCEAQHALDALLQQRKDGLPVTLPQILQADAAFTDAAYRENVACIDAELGVLYKDLQLHETHYESMRNAMRANLHKRDALVEQGKRLTLAIEAKKPILKGLAARIDATEKLATELLQKRG